jgi:hypothetical protein
MSSLLAINPEAINNWEQIRLLKSSIGQSRQFFLSELPPSFALDIKQSKLLSEIDKHKIISYLEYLQKESALYRLNSLSFDKTNFISSIQKVIKRESRLSLVVSNETLSEKIKSFDDLDNNDLRGPVAFSGKYTPDALWDFIEFYARTSKRLAIVSRYNHLLSRDCKRNSKFYDHLVKLIEGIQNSACYELLIYTKEDPGFQEQNDITVIEAQLKKALGRNRLPQYGIHYFICEDNNYGYQNTSLHERHIVTNHVVLNLNDDLGGGSVNQGIQISTDPLLDSKKRHYWLDRNHGLKITNEVHLTR